MDSMREPTCCFEHYDPEKFRKLGIAVIEGAARLRSRNEVEVKAAASSQKTSSSPRLTNVVPPIEGLRRPVHRPRLVLLQNDFRALMLSSRRPDRNRAGQVLSPLRQPGHVVEMLDDIISK